MHKKGMTLIEMLTVVTIIAVLAAVLMPALGKARTKAKCATAQRNIDQLVSALTSYATDYGTYPYDPANATYTDTTVANSNSDYLIFCLEATGTRGQGPYLTIPSNQKYDANAGVPGSSWKDPWDNPYKYRYPLATGEDTPVDTQADCLKRGIQFQIWSTGPDKDAGGTDYGTIGPGNDDITNW